MARHRPAKEGGYQRGEETRLRIILAALNQFAQHGYDGASTRQIASAAGVNAPALQYYFDHKEGLYLACVEHILERLWAQLDTVVSAAESAVADPACDDSVLIERYLAILSSFMSFIVDAPETDDWRRFIGSERAGMGPASSGEMMEQGFNRRLAHITRAIVGRLTAMPADHEITIIRTLSFNSQGTVFYAKRNAVLKALNWESIDQQRMETVRAVLIAQNRLTLQAMVAERNKA